MVQGERQVVLETVLRDLLEAPVISGGRKKLARAIGVNEATISHYLTRRIRPSFDTLVQIAQYYNVSLDYLVFGERPHVASDEGTAGVRAQIRRAVIEASDASGRHLDLVTRISRQLHAKIDEAARVLREEGETHGPVGFVTDAEAIGMEACVTRMRIMTRLFQSDVNEGEPGAFLDVVIQNLRIGRTYQYLLYGEGETWTVPVERFRDLVVRSGVPVEVLRQNLQFRWLSQELISSVCLLDLDVELIKRQEPILWERHQDNISPGGTWAYLSIERPDAQGGVTIEPTYLSSTLRQFNRDWAVARPI
ncbi:hypothetical protein SRB5_52280 [Streptomyces sp. RB5]|uniref:HTH cro/C1-type domain-containing protein n=1 Tax=Streptomyces smaragdinus TaxID=2585196 RepID=A0A7K0CNQ9_9ACTN|nr:helix-turn-helix transcriptional regulator [Streptomyces smaragdinus]MQY15051.1 hypothetical protein [Streptomyces smaragdinus]